MSGAPVRADLVETSSPASGGWARGLLWVLGASALTAVVWWTTGADIAYGVVVATTALGVTGGGPTTARRALTGLAIAAALALVGAFTFGQVGFGLGTGQRILQGAGGVLGAALILLAMGLIRRRAGQRQRP